VKNIIIISVVILASANILMFGTSRAKPATIIYSHAPIFELHSTIKNSDAIALNAQTIIYLGKSEFVYPLIGKDTKVKDFKSTAFIYPTSLTNIEEVKLRLIKLAKLAPLNREKLVRILMIKQDLKKDQSSHFIIVDQEIEKLKVEENITLFDFI
jgi:hypothetical protein